MPTNCNPQSANFCNPPAGATTILTVEAQGGLAINLLGIHVDVCPLCIAVYTDGVSTSALTDAQQAEVVNGLLQAVKGLIPSIPSA